MRSRWRQLLAGGAPDVLLSIVTLGLLILGLAGLEWVLRVTSPGSLYRLKGDTGTTVYSEVYGWTLRDGFQGDDNGAQATINARGHRGEDHAYHKTPGRTRVLMLGDSITYGLGVEDGETFSALVQARNPQLEVVNLGVGGYGTDQELIQLEEEGLRYEPDIVVLNFCLFSDFADNAIAYNLYDPRQPKPYFTWDGRALILHKDHVKLSWFGRMAQWLSDRSYLYNRLVAMSGVPTRDRKRGTWVRVMDKVMKNLPVVADLTFRLIQRTNDVSRQAGARFLVVIHPDEFGFRHPSDSKLLEAFCSTHLLEGITVVDLGERYRADGLPWDKIAMDSPGHLTTLGHQVAADVIAAWVSKPLPESWDYQKSCLERHVLKESNPATK